MSGVMLKDWIDWESVLKVSRYAGGHSEVMERLFMGAEVIAFWIEDDWQGEEAFAYRMPYGAIVVVTDSFGSCSGCLLSTSQSISSGRRQKSFEQCGTAAGGESMMTTRMQLCLSSERTA